MKKLWAGRTDGETSKIADDFNSSIKFDKRLYVEDINGSIAHTLMLQKQGIISSQEASNIIQGLGSILADLESGNLSIDETSEDIHMFIESILTERIGNDGKKLHTARSRNDQTVLDLRMYVMKEMAEIEGKIKGLISVITSKAEENIDVIMPGYTHLQRAQPILFSHQLLSYAFMLLRDLGRLKDCYTRTNISPIGSCALAGTTFNTDRDYEAELLGFSDVCLNSIDGVSDRDFVVELLSSISIVMMHLSRLSEEIILWSSWEFKFITLSDDFTTGSSIMPQKKNSDMAELVRGKTGRVYGDLIGTLTMLKGLPLAYNKDMQEDKESIFDAIDTVKMCLDVYTPMISTMKVNSLNMLNAAKKGYINATDLADYLAKKGLPFREGYKIVGEIVSNCIQKEITLEEFPIEEYKKYSELFEEDIYSEISLENCVNKRVSKGGTSKKSVEEQIEYIKSKIN